MARQRKERGHAGIVLWTRLQGLATETRPIFRVETKKSRLAVYSAWAQSEFNNPAMEAPCSVSATAGNDTDDGRAQVVVIPE
jgi:hypothetical protein